jgi:putative ABC transport system permease protein
MLLFKLAARNALRNVTRTALTAATVVLGTALLTVGIAWVEGVLGDLMERGAGASGHVRLVDPEFAEKETLMPLYANLEDTAGLIDAIADQPGVIGVYPRIMNGATLTVGEEIGDVFGLVVGAPPELFDKHYGAREALVEGDWFTDDPADVVIGYTLAERAEAKVGDEIVLLGMTQDSAMSRVKGNIVGITRAGNPLLDQQVFVPLATAQYFADIPDGATELLVYTDDYNDAPELAAALGKMPEVAEVTVQAWSEREPWAGMMGITAVVQGVLVGTIVFITALGVWNTMMMSVLERTSEIGVLRAMGMARGSTVGLFVIEALAIAVVGGLVGVALGAIPAAYLTMYGIELGEQVTGNMSADVPMSATMYASLTPRTVVVSFVLGMVMAIMGAAPPALRAASIQPVVAMRRGR